MYETILYHKEEGVATITLNRPHVMNACDKQMNAELYDALKQAEMDGDVRAVVLTGTGRAFCAGADLASAGNDPEFLKNLTNAVRERYNPIIIKMQTMTKPVIAGVNGAAAGAGAAFALAADIRIASENAKFSIAFSKIGLVPDSGASYFLTRLVGIGKAMELALTGDIVKADEAERLGLVNKSVPADQFEATLYAYAKQLANGPTLALGLTKRAIYEASEKDLLGALETEAQYQGIAGRSRDFAEGVQAFLEKRAPKFEGR